MKNITYNINSIDDFKNKVELSYNNLINTIEMMNKLIVDNDGMVNSKTGNTLKYTIKDELYNEKNRLINDKDSFDNLFSNQIIPAYNDLVNKTRESIGE